MPAPDLHTIAEKTEVNMTFAELETAKGALDPVHMEAFKALVQAEARLLGDIRVEVVDQRKGTIHLAGFPDRMTFPVLEHAALDESKYSELTQDHVDFDCSEFRGAIPLSDSNIRNNLLKNRLGQFIMERAAPRVALDMESYCLSSDTALAISNPDYSKFDGFIKQVTTNVLNPVAAADPDETLFYYMGLALPTKYWRRKEDLRFYCNAKHEAIYKKLLQAKYGDKGYEMILDNKRYQMTNDGIILFPLDQMPQDTIILTHKDNMVVMMETGMEWEMEREPKKARWLYHVRYWLDCGYTEEEGVVIHKNVKIPALPTE